MHIRAYMWQFPPFHTHHQYWWWRCIIPIDNSSQFFINLFAFSFGSKLLPIIFPFSDLWWFSSQKKTLLKTNLRSYMSVILYFYQVFWTWKIFFGYKKSMLCYIIDCVLFWVAALLTCSFTTMHTFVHTCACVEIIYKYRCCWNPIM